MDSSLASIPDPTKEVFKRVVKTTQTNLYSDVEEPGTNYYYGSGIDEGQY